MLYRKGYKAGTLVICAILAMCCTHSSRLDYALDSAGSNRSELETVLDHYRSADPNPEKLRAAEFLIENLPAHYSYAGAEIYEYYDYATHILADTTLTPEQQRDSLLIITDARYAPLPGHTIPDAQIITADFLIDNIDKSYTQWTTCPWASQVTFDEYIHYDEQTTKNISYDLKRKYPESWNVVDQRRKILGARIQCSDNPGFRDALTLYTIGTTDIPARIELPETARPYRYWRYMSPDGSNGSIAELKFYDEAGEKLTGRGIANQEAGQDVIVRAFDGNLLSNFETDLPDGNWVGIDIGSPTEVRYFSVSPRSDDNDICPGNEYELLCFDGDKWRSLGYQWAESTILHYNNIPVNTLLWLRNYTRGNNERPFMINENSDTEWW